ncbi:hypothetical protein FHETE_7709 [Fusarium heterosporum]|uniref:Apple domain-containing protein n=1 Tax=Fusarium heterosporum TaxID=42747 RepID=A0A8H5SZQ8_FUSHE|nr:hypothetical protein FHETE_7709 [Fusarium heterosporum]
MINSKRIVATLACLSVIGVNAGPCKPAATTDGAAFPTTATTTSDAISTATETTSAAGATTTSAAADIPCNNEIYRGTARRRGYTVTDVSSEQECWDSCVRDDACKSWFFQSVGNCNLYTETLEVFSTPSNEDGLLIGSRNCSPRDYIECNDQIGFGSVSGSPVKQIEHVALEANCAQLCMSNSNCEVWQYDGPSQTCNMFSGSYQDIFTPQVDAPQGSTILLAGYRSCSSDFFKPQMGNCNGQISWNHGATDNYRVFPQFNTIPLCARACSIDPMCLSWLIWDGDSDCWFSRYAYYDDPSDICTAGSRDCGVP